MSVSILGKNIINFLNNFDNEPNRQTIVLLQMVAIPTNGKI